MNIDEARRYGASLRTDLPEIDLHGLYPADAKDQLERALYQAYQSGHDGLKVIYGVGTGVLGSQCVAYLEKHPLVATIAEDVGACVLLFHSHLFTT